MLKGFSLSCIYLKRDTTEETVKFACYAKGQGWTTRVTELFCKTPYGITHKLEGLNGLIKFFSERAKIEEKILSRGFIKCSQYTISENNWDKARELMWKDY